MNKLSTKILISTVAFTPLLASAATVESILEITKDILDFIIPMLMILATVVFLWGVIMYITAAGDEDRLKLSRTYMIYGLVGLFVMVAVWGIINALVTTFDVGGEGVPERPGSL
jgi:hypothetical protein